MNPISDLAYLLYSNSRLLIQKIQLSLDEVGLTYTQYLTLAVLWEQDGQYVNQIGKKLELDSGTLTPLLKKLEAQNYLRRIRSEEDERKVKVELTYPGKTLQGKVEELLKVFSEEIELISDPQLEKLNSSLSGMLSKLKSLD
ncbi:MarR family transcriptional regulator [Algoriphagus sp. NF]|jgi:Transcriptional regulators|uniref:HTH-type transcriptional regulator SarZ n=1 Tax=Algoriphagus marincola TaxID=264027 RepID=A0ABS7N5G5_9BACT|nr:MULTISPECIES: MarR family transcriptional regulator [Algoriphagus]MBY5951581.1 MarR family transcriptional regulator [Algoriphagus marincola]MCR9083264.1 MarR family transcriptional regulator [Cyclobacteriaceae bacterium]MDE0561515.1 MarR family transcriptional regulator [Algoriphagus sp. NF]